MNKQLYLSVALTLFSPLSPAQEKLDTVEVVTNPENNIMTEKDILLNKTGGSTASLLENTAGVHLQTAGGISSLPVIHGLADDRLNIKIDGAQITSSCPNHMNPVLAYIDPTKVSQIETMAGITPVSAGGDSIGGSIIIKSKTPEFASADEKIKQKLKASSFFKSNNENRGAAIEYGIATEKLSISYSGLDESAHNYRNGKGHRVKGTLYNQNNQSATIASKLNSGIVALKLTRAVVPYSGFVNQPMDMNDNVSNAGNLSYKGQLGKIDLDANIFHTHTNHYMNKITSQRTGSMPMYTRSNESGYQIKAGTEISKDHLFKFGSDFARYRLDDWWPAVAGSSMMGPGTFESVKNGKRDRLGLFIEADSSWTNSLSTNLGLRTDIVTMDAGNVVGYNNGGMMANLPVDAAAFNAKSREKKDHNYDATFLTSYKLNQKSDIELGFARKTRSPNIYERYAWAGSTTDPATSGAARMDMRMINWFGDGNGYVGDIDLRPEVAHTLSTSLSLHDELQKNWGIKLTPYYTQVENFIDVDLLSTVNGVNYLKFANHDAIIFGADLSANAKILNHETLGEFKVKMIGSYTRGYRKDGKSELYHLMPLNGKVTFEHALGKWTTGLSTHLVSSKKQVSSLRLEPKTAGYALLDLGTSYQLNKMIKIDLGLTNLLDHNYGLPLGGVDQINYAVGSRTPVAGMGRSINTAVTIDFI